MVRHVHPCRDGTLHDSGSDQTEIAIIRPTHNVFCHPIYMVGGISPAKRAAVGISLEWGLMLKEGKMSGSTGVS